VTIRRTIDGGILTDMGGEWKHDTTTSNILKYLFSHFYGKIFFCILCYRILMMEQITRETTPTTSKARARAKLVGTIAAGLLAPMAVTAPFIGEKTVDACESGYTAPISANDGFTDNLARNAARLLCGAEIPKPDPIVPQTPGTLQV
jgi:hypothetical protein